MSDLIRKPLTVALAAVLVFSVCVPVPSGVSAYDRLRYEQAEATPAVVLAVPVILATAAAAYGVYVTGTSVTEYNANVQALYDGYSNASSYWSASWANYCQEKGGFDNAMQSCVTADGNISLQTLTDAGFWDGLRSYTVYCVNNGTAVEGVTSNLDSLATLTIRGNTCNVVNFDNYVMPYAGFDDSWVGDYQILGVKNRPSSWFVVYFCGSRSTGYTWENNGYSPSVQIIAKDGFQTGFKRAWYSYSDSRGNI